jgi:methylated-DNA-[protein]-cysteine S-methyltransferase
MRVPHDLEEVSAALSDAGAPQVPDPAAAARRFSRRAQDEGLVDVAYTLTDTPVGSVLVAATARGLVRLSFGSEPADVVLEELSEDISPRVLESPERLDEARRQLDDYFEGRRQGFELPLDWQLSRGFSRKVLEHTAQIPFGQVSSYREMAAAAGSPRGARAAGNALGGNPIAIVVPCHRVLHSGGGLGGYGGGLDTKRFLLRLEGALQQEL